MMPNKRNKISFISYGAYSLFNHDCEAFFGGSEVQLYQLANFVASHNEMDVSFIVSDFGQPRKEKFGSITVYRIYRKFKMNVKYLFSLYYLFSLFRTLKKVDADIYVQRAAGFETGAVALFCKYYRKKFIYMTASSIDVNKAFRKNNPILGFFYEYGLRNADVVITQNEEHKKLLKKNFNKDSIVIKNSFNIPDKIPDLNEKRFILWIGSSQKLKQPEIFLEIAKATPEEKFVTIMPKNNIKVWKEISKKAQDISNLEFIEKVPFNEIDVYYKKAKLFINTSAFEGFPNTFVQASMYGTPIVSLNINPDNFLDEYVCGFCADGNFGKMLSNIKRITYDKAERQRMSENAYNYAIKNHNILVNALEFEKIIRNLCRN